MSKPTIRPYAHGLAAFDVSGGGIHMLVLALQQPDGCWLARGSVFGQKFNCVSRVSADLAAAGVLAHARDWKDMKSPPKGDATDN